MMASNDQLLISILEQLSATTTSNGTKLNRIIDLLEKIEARENNGLTLGDFSVLTGPVVAEMYGEMEVHTRELALRVQIVE